MIVVSDGEENERPHVSEVVDQVSIAYDWGLQGLYSN